MMNALRPFFVPLSTQKEKMRTIKIYDPYAKLAAMQSDAAAGPGLHAAIGYLTLWGMPQDAAKSDDTEVTIWATQYEDLNEIVADYVRPEAPRYTMGAIFRRNRENATWEFHS